jgi:methyl-accepting chemotaxis protein
MNQTNHTLFTEETLNYISFIFLGIVVLCFLVSWIYFVYQKNQDRLVEKRRWIENLPTFISTIGVLGTFAGITLGLVNFDPNNLDASIPLLLSGLKTAFFTSLAGMIGSLFLSKIVSSGYDNIDKGVSDINMAAGLITESVAKMEKASAEKMDLITQKQDEFINKMDLVYQKQESFFSSLLSKIQEQSKDSQEMRTALNVMANHTNEAVNVVGKACSITADIALANNETRTLLENKLETAIQKLDDINKDSQGIKATLDIISNHSNESIAILGKSYAVAADIAETNSESLALLKDRFEATIQKLDDLNNAIDGRLESITISVGNVEEALGNQTKSVNTLNDSVKAVNDNVAEIVEASTGTYSTQNEIIDEIKKLSPVIRDEVTEIEEKMSETNVLLTEKFEEFSELLRKSNTEALVEVMKGVTEEFEKQMNALISKLIKENFEQLNESVGRMITWQEENKNMITSLTSKYNQMNTNFEETSTTLKEVEADTKLLINDGGKLHQIVLGLEQVMAKDKDFVATAKAMRDAAEANSKNIAEYKEYTENLNKWVEKQRNFAQVVNDLINKLEELNKLRDYNNEFWADAKRNLMEAQKQLHDSAQFLQGEIQTLDQHFYNRLSETLSQLDVCIQAMIKDKR